jgi:four helix bundle protein
VNVAAGTSHYSPMPENEPVPASFADPLERMAVYRLAKGLTKPAFKDCELLLNHPITVEVAAQLYTAIGSIRANISEGYARSSGRDRARIFEYALGSARESTEWYDSAEPVIGVERVAAAKETLGEIRRLLQAIIPRERKRTIRPGNRS